MADPYPKLSLEYEKKIQEAINKAWDELRRFYTYEQLDNIIETQGITGLFPLIDSLPDYVSKNIRPVIEDAITASGRAVIGILPTLAITAPLTFSLVLPTVSSYVNNYVAIRVAEISSTTQQAIRSAINEAVVTGRNPRQIARTFRASVGLTINQELSVQRFKEALMTGNKSYVDGLKTAPGVSDIDSLSDKQIDKLVEQYRLRTVSRRAETIARTEALTAISVGQDLAIKNGLVTGSISNQLMKKWMDAKDGRTRDAHTITGATNGWIPINQPFVTPLGPMMFPRDPSGVASNVINCRCRIKYALPEDAID